MKKKCIAIALNMCSVFLFSQDSSLTESVKTWKRGGVVALNFSQAAFRNWSAGGQDAFSGTTFISLYANYKNNKSAWDNTLDLAYGILKQQKSAIQKSDDKIDFSSKYGYSASKHWYYTGLLGFKTQFAPGYDYPDDSLKTSNFMAPGYGIASVGMDYKVKDVFTLLLSPLTAKITFVRNVELADAGSFGVDPAEYDTAGVKIKNGKTMRMEFGGYLKAQFRKDIAKNINMQSKLDLFFNYLHNPLNVDVNWEVLLNMKINKLLSANISTQLIYDDDILVAVDKDNDGIAESSGPRTQFKEILSIGFSYKF